MSYLTSPTPFPSPNPSSAAASPSPSTAMAKKRKVTPRPASTPASTAAEPAPPSPAKEGELVYYEEEIEVEDDDAPAAPAAAEGDDAADADADAADAAGDGDDAPAEHDMEEDQEEAAAADAASGGDDDAAETDPASVLKLLEPLPKDQIAELLRDAAVKHPDVLQQIVRAADVDPSHRKIFVHGLGWDTTTDDLKSAYSPYGEIEDCKAVVDKATGKSKGYGFVLFKRRAGAQNALKEPQKKIGNRMTSCQLASAGPVPAAAPPVSEYTQRKIYVSNVAADLDPGKVTQFFAKFGEIEEGPLGLDKATGKFKGFCLYVYKSVESAKKALEEPHKNYEGQVLHCQKAIDGPKSSKPGFQFQQGSSSFPGGALARNGGAAGHVPGGGAHLMAPSPAGLGYNQAAPPSAAAAGLNPALGQALTALLTTPGLLGALGSAGLNQPGLAPQMQGGYGSQDGYGAPPPMQGGYGSRPGWQGGPGRNQGHLGGRPPYGSR